MTTTAAPGTPATPTPSTVRAVVVREHGRAAIEPLQLRELAPTDVLVRIEATGICHSDVSVMNGVLPGSLPVVLGHEGAGRVEAIGSAVTRVASGDRVVLAAIPSCGTCWTCSRGQPYLCERAPELKRPPFRTAEGEIVRATSGLGTFSEAVVVDELAVVPVPAESTLPSEHLAVLGCAVITGAGAALNLATIRAGTSVLVTGAGGVGLSAVQGARAQGAFPIVAVDPSPDALELARTCGATHAFEPHEHLADAAMPLTAGRGFDTTIECVGSSSAFLTAYELTRRGGEVVMVGVGPPDEPFPIALTNVVTSGKRLIGCVYGGASVFRDIPRFVAMAERGHLDLAALLGRRIALTDAPAALHTPSPTPGRTVVVNTA